MLSNLEIHSLPDLQHRAPTSSGPLLDLDAITDFISTVVKPSGVGVVPTVLVLNLEGRFPSASALFELLVPLGRAIASGTYGELALVLATPDPALGSVIRAIAQSYGLGMFLAPSSDSLDKAEAIGPLSPSDIQTLAIFQRLGGRASVSTFAQAANIDHKAAGNRLASLDQRQLLLRVDRPRREGHVYLDPRVALPAEEPSDPRSPEFGLPPELRADVRALAEMQGREPSAVLADAWQDFLRKHAEELSSEHRKVAGMMKAGDKKGVAEYTARHAARRSRSQAPPKQT